MSNEDTTEAIYCSSGVQILEAPALTAEGWHRRTVTDPGRIPELEQLYASLGYETTTAVLDPASFGEACTSCAVGACALYVALFTRKKDVDASAWSAT